MITCTKCGVEQPDENFARRANRKTRRTQCNSCRAAYDRQWAAEHREQRQAIEQASYQRHREKQVARAATWNKANPDRVFASHLRRKFGITVEDYEEMRERQGDLCAICRCPEQAIDSRNGQRRRLHVDHDHVTKHVRGLLCTRCNVAIGYLLDDPERALALAAYLVERTPARPHGIAIDTEGAA